MLFFEELVQGPRPFLFSVPFFLLIHRSYLYILSQALLLVICIANFFCSVDCLFVLLMVLFLEQTFCF